MPVMLPPRYDKMHTKEPLRNKLDTLIHFGVYWLNVQPGIIEEEICVFIALSERKAEEDCRCS